MIVIYVCMHVCMYVCMYVCNINHRLRGETNLEVILLP